MRETPGDPLHGDGSRVPGGNPGLSEGRGSRSLGHRVSRDTGTGERLRSFSGTGSDDYSNDLSNTR